MVRHGSANAPVFERTQTHAACFASRPLTVSVNLCRHCGVSLVVVVLLGAVVIFGWFAFPVGLRTAESFNQTVSRFCGARSAPHSPCGSGVHARTPFSAALTAPTGRLLRRRPPTTCIKHAEKFFRYLCKKTVDFITKKC